MHDLEATTLLVVVVVVVVVVVAEQRVDVLLVAEAAVGVGRFVVV